MLVKTRMTGAVAADVGRKRAILLISFHGFGKSLMLEAVQKKGFRHANLEPTSQAGISVARQVLRCASRQSFCA